MTLTVTLLRHAKSSWGDVVLQDFDRPLSERGVRDAPRMAAWLASVKIAPDLVLCSTAARTRQTLDAVRSALPSAVDIQFVDALYMASATTILASIRAVPVDVQHVMVIAHNPGLEQTAHKLIGAGDAQLRQALSDKFPSAGCAVIVFNQTKWSAIAEGGGTLLRWMTPRRLPA